MKHSDPPLAWERLPLGTGFDGLSHDFWDMPIDGTNNSEREIFAVLVSQSHEPSLLTKVVGRRCLALDIRGLSTCRF